MHALGLSACALQGLSLSIREAQRIMSNDTRNCTDLGNSERMIDRHGPRLKYVCELKQWIEWTDGRWSTIPSPIDQAKETIRSIYAEAANSPEASSRVLGKWAYQSESAGSIRAMISLASQDRGISVSVSEFDTDTDQINCTNGVVDLRTGELEEHSSSQRNLKQARASLRRDASCSLWMRFLRDVFQGDEELISYMQRALGYGLTGRIDEHCMFIAYGLGSNGKTTLFETVLEVIGDYGRTAEFSNFLATDKQDTRKMEAVGHLRGVRLAIASETDSTKKWHESLVKKLTGGDTLTGLKMYGDSYEFTPTHKLWFQANHLPTAKDASHGFWRRIRVVPFKARFEGKTVDADLRAKLLRERDGIFAWLVEGARLYLEKGSLGELPRAITEATEDYRNDNDVLTRFISERLETSKGARLRFTDAYEAYNDWRTRNSLEVDRSEQKFFANAMRERGVASKRFNAGNMFLDYRLKEKELSPACRSDLGPWEAKGAGISVYKGRAEVPPAPRKPSLQEYLVMSEDERERLMEEAVAL